MGRRIKIIEIYATENKKDETISFYVERCKDTEIANALMKRLCFLLSKPLNNDYDLEIETEEN